MPASGWTLAAVCASALAGLPIIAVVWLALAPSGGPSGVGDNIWPHLMATVLPGYLTRTGGLLLGVGSLTLIIGTATAWLVTVCSFPFRRVFLWALLLPLAMPTYLVAYVYVDMLEVATPGGWGINLRSLPGAIAVLSLVLYPYVFVAARVAFAVQSGGVFEVARTMGCSPWRGFFSLTIPLARPALAAGVALVLMECLNDIGAMEHLGVRTLTVGLYDVWLERGNLAGGAQIALVMLAVVVVLLAAERLLRRHRHYHLPLARPLPPFSLHGVKAAAAVVACLMPVAAGFIVPVAALIRHALNLPETSAATAVFFSYALNSIVLAGLAALAAAAVAVVLAYGMRVVPGRFVRLAVRLAVSGYALPGAVLALGILVPLAAFDNGLDALLKATLGISTGLLLTGSITALVFAYVVRFLALSFAAVETGFSRISPAMDMAARCLGRSPGRVLTGVHLPIARAAVLTAVLLVFVDAMKELPATLILRPFDFDTLATHVYTLASLGLIEASAPASLAIVLVGLVPVIILTRAVSLSLPALSPVMTPLAPAPGDPETDPATPDWPAPRGS